MAASAVFLIALLSTSPAVAQADYTREKRWADEIMPAIVIGDPVWLEAAGRKFLGIYTPTPKARAGVVVVHGMGVHPDWGLINPLRSGLAEQGYTTLSVQVPVLAADADGSQYPPLYPEASARLGAAVRFLRKRGTSKVAIVSHSLGARMANHYFNSNADAAAEVNAWVAIGLSGEVSKPETLKAPTLDLYGERDFPAVLENAEKRAAVLRKIRGSAQAEVPGADHFFNGREAELVKHVKLFLDRALK
ncbi:MAG: DUF3530 family protein [Betaproteobacteria bacterium]